MDKSPQRHPVLSNQQLAYLRGLQESPIWSQILKMLEDTGHQLLSYSETKDRRTDDWIYRSGVSDERRRILSLLKPSKT